MGASGAAQEHGFIGEAVISHIEAPHPAGKAEQPGKQPLQHVEPPIRSDIGADRQKIVGARDRGEPRPASILEPIDRKWPPERAGSFRDRVERAVRADGERLQRGIVAQPLEVLVARQLHRLRRRGVGVAHHPMLGFERHEDLATWRHRQPFAVVVVERKGAAIGMAHRPDLAGGNPGDLARRVARDPPGQDRALVGDRHEGGAIGGELQPRPAAKCLVGD